MLSQYIVLRYIVEVGVSMKLPHVDVSEMLWGALDLLGCLLMVAIEMLAFWLFVPKP